MCGLAAEIFNAIVDAVLEAVTSGKKKAEPVVSAPRVSCISRIGHEQNEIRGLIKVSYINVIIGLLYSLETF